MIIYSGGFKGILTNLCLIPKASGPSCTATVPPDGTVEEGQEFSMQCIAHYTGVPGWSPVTEWRDPNGIIHDVIDNSREGILDTTVEITATADQNGFIFYAETMFIDYEGPLSPGTARNIPDYSYVWEFGPIDIQCECFRMCCCQTLPTGLKPCSFSRFGRFSQEHGADSTPRSIFQE